MNHSCPYCSLSPEVSDARTLVVKRGQFYRKSDSRLVQRYACSRCQRFFSSATLHSSYRQKKRQKNSILRELLCSGVSLRRAARILHLSRTTIGRKLIFLGAQSKEKLSRDNLLRPKAIVVEFDDQETFEHTKCKPLSITLAVESKTRRILGFEISQMSAKGKLAKIALKKYGKRKDTRFQGRRKLFERLADLVSSHATFKSDENPHYGPDVRNYFPFGKHETFKGQRGSIVGQGELKKIRFDPIFSLNHTCAMTRANMNRLFRKTWCTTKDPKRLEDHFAIYALYHNEMLERRRPTSAA